LKSLLKTLESQIAQQDNDRENDRENDSEKLSDRQAKLLKLIRNDDQISTANLAKILKVGVATVNREIAKLKDMQYLQRVGPDKGGHWEVLR
jgi:ATP-dependent DNA helicase RecG